MEKDMNPSPKGTCEGLTLASLQRSHIERQEEWCPDQKPDLSFRGNELGGECGEAQNVIKKLERERHGWRGSRDTVEHLAEELADVIHCAILVAITAGIEIEPAVVAKFNNTSEKNGLTTFLAAKATAKGETTFKFNDDGTFELNDSPAAAPKNVLVKYAFCCPPGSVLYCDCVNKNHGTAVMGENEAGDDYPIVGPAPTPREVGS